MQLGFTHVFLWLDGSLILSFKLLSLKYVKFTLKPFRPKGFFFERLLIVDSNSLVDLGLFRLPISP